MNGSLKILAAIMLIAAIACGTWQPSQAGKVNDQYKVLAPIAHGRLTIFPVGTGSTHDTSQFLTLDEGVRSGDVVVTEAGQVQGLVRRGRPVPVRGSGEVNRLVLVNNSNRPLILLAGEIVTGGKQDRVIGKDRIVPANSDPIDLSVFCVEPGRWTATSDKFGSLGVQMAQPSVRNKAMVAKDQQEVWNEVNNTRVNAAPMAGIVAGSASAEHAGSSYAKLMDTPEMKREVDQIAAPVERDYNSAIHQLRAQNAVGVVVAVDGQIIWADIFANTALLEKYWPKLVRSYAAEALIGRSSGRKVDVAAAQAYLDDLTGRREVVDSEPGVFRHAEITGDGYKVFQLTSLLPKTGFDLHIAKMEQ